MSIDIYSGQDKSCLLTTTMFTVLCGPGSGSLTPVPANSPPEAETPLIVQGKYLESLWGTLEMVGTGDTDTGFT